MIMKKTKLFLLFMVVFCFTLLTKQNNTIATEKNELFSYERYDGVLDTFPIIITTIPQLEIPQTKPTDEIIYHLGYSLLYCEEHEQAFWVAYQLTKEEAIKIYDRTNNFKPDPKVKTGTATDDDYKGTGYDRGHLAPAADMGWSQIAVSESFYYSNMSPQNQSFNRGIWKKLEELVRNWAIENDNVYIVTGPVLTNGLKTIGPNKVSVPHYYYKVILDYTNPEIKGIGFILPNEPSSKPLQSFVVTIDSVEKVTGLDFFSKLPDTQEQYIESNICISCWTWNINAPKTESDEYKSDSSVQCKGKTKSGVRCKRMTNSPNGRCFQHGGS